MSEEISKYEVFNKYEEAKKLLLIDYDINKDKRYLVAIEACEKQIPKKAKQYNDKSIFIYAGVFYCPSCQENVSMDDVYCCQCGQKLDWSEVENE